MVETERSARETEVSIVIPTYNERENLLLLLEKTKEVVREHSIQAEILIVDDNSPDGTGKVADALAEEDKNIKVIHRHKKLGLGSAYKTAFKKATGRVIITMDADLSHDPVEIPHLLGVLEASKVDVAIGSRYVNAGRVVGWSWKRKLISKTANFLLKNFLGLQVKDITSGYRAYRRHVLDGILCKTDSNGFFFQVEALYRVIKRGFSVAEHPICFTNRREGKSKLGLAEYIAFLTAMFRLKMSSLRGRGFEDP